MPIWNFHGQADDVEPVDRSRRMIEALRRAGGYPRYAEYRGVGHDVFMWAYTEPALVEWMFARARTGRVFRAMQDAAGPIADAR